MWDLIVSVPDHCLSFYFPLYYLSLASPNPTYLPAFPHTPIIPCIPYFPLPSYPSPLIPIPLIPYPNLSPTLPYPSGFSRPYHTLLSLLLLFPRIPSPTYLPSHLCRTLAFSTFRFTRIPSPVPCPTLPYTSRPVYGPKRFLPYLYLNPSLLYPPLPSQQPPPQPYATHLLPTFPLLYSRIPSTPLIYHILLYPPISSPLLSSPTSPYPIP